MKSNIKVLLITLFLCFGCIGCGNSKASENIVTDSAQESSAPIQAVAEISDNKSDSKADVEKDNAIDSIQDIQEDSIETEKDLLSWLKTEIVTGSIIYEKDGATISFNRWEVSDEGEIDAFLDVKNDNPDNKRFIIMNNNANSSDRVYITLNGIGTYANYRMKSNDTGSYNTMESNMFEVISGESYEMRARIKTSNVEQYMTLTNTDINKVPLQWFGFRLHVKLGSDGQDEYPYATFYTVDYNQDDQEFFGEKVNTMVIDKKDVDIYLKEDADGYRIFMLTESEEPINIQNGVVLFANGHKIDCPNQNIHCFMKNFANVIRVRNTIDELRRECEIPNGEPVYVNYGYGDVVCEITSSGVDANTNETGTDSTVYSVDDATRMFTNYLLETYPETSKEDFDVSAYYENGVYHFDAFLDNETDSSRPVKIGNDMTMDPNTGIVEQELLGGITSIDFTVYDY